MIINANARRRGRTRALLWGGSILHGTAGSNAGAVGSQEPATVAISCRTQSTEAGMSGFDSRHTDPSRYRIRPAHLIGG